MANIGARGAWLVGIAAFAAVATTGCASTQGDWRQRYLEKERESQDIASQLSDERGQRAAAVSQVEEARARIGVLERENDALRASAASTGATPTAAPSGTDMSRVLGELQKAHPEATVYETVDGNVAIVLSSDITFGAGSKELSAQGRKSLDGLASEMKGQFAGMTLRIEGHTDGDPIKKSKFTDNFELGAERALSVLRYLVKTHDIPAERLIAASRGETVPVADNKSDGGKSKNRRVELVVVVPKDAAAAK
jgi:flagellar motor protein MotB